MWWRPGAAALVRRAFLPKRTRKALLPVPYPARECRRSGRQPFLIYSPVQTWWKAWPLRLPHRFSAAGPCARNVTSTAALATRTGCPLCRDKPLPPALREVENALQS